MTGPKYLFCGTYQINDAEVMRVMLEGLNTWARQWSETITILDNGSLKGLENEVGEFRHLAYRRIPDWVRPNIVIAFMDRLSQNRDTEKLLRRAESEGIPAYVVSRYGV